MTAGLALLAAAPASADHPAGGAGRSATSSELSGAAHLAEHARRGRLRPQIGVRSAPEAAVGPEEAVGRWSAPFDIPVMGIHSALLPTGKVMWWSYPKNPTRPYGDPSFPNEATAWLWDPVTNARKKVDPPLLRDPADGKLKPANIWCSGESLLSDGRLLVTGGNLAYQGSGDPVRANFAGLNKAYTFNPWNETWTEQPDMRHGRWYPSQGLLPDGRTVIMSGLDQSGQEYSTNKDIEVFTPSAELDGRGTMSLLGQRGSNRSPDGGLYPHLFSMPSGRLMVAGPELNDSWALKDFDRRPEKPETDVLPDSSSDQLPDASQNRLWGSAVMVPPSAPGTASTKVRLIGGSTLDGQRPATASTETLDENQPASGWQSSGSLNIARSHLNTVLLPTGSMVTVGGGVGSRAPQGQWAADDNQRQVELFDPVSGAWSLGAAQTEPRAYHSTAILLPDGRVLSAGDDLNGGIDRDTAEIYEPPYLFRPGGRPSITSAPAVVRYGLTFGVGTPTSVPGGDPDRDKVTSAALVAPGTATHATNVNQRVVPLPLTETGSGVELAAPVSANAAPPGYYMLFLMSADGEPSLARWVSLGDAQTPEPGRLVVQKLTEPAGSSTPFSLSAGPGAFQLTHGQSRTQVLPAGSYSIQENSRQGYQTPSIACSDGRASASGRLAVEVAAGTTLTCISTSRKTVTQLPLSGPVAGGSDPAAGTRADLSPPVVRLARGSGRLAGRGLVRGTVWDRSGVRSVKVAVGVQRRGRCRWWSPSRRRLSGSASRRACRRPALIRARVVRRGKRLVWEAKLRRPLPRGRYLVALRGQDALGNARTTLGRAAPRVAVPGRR